MTLLVTVDIARRIIMVSDRRVTVPRRHGGFAYIDDEWNKAVVVTCPETQFGAVFAGLAAFVKRTQTGGLAETAVCNNTSALIQSCSNVYSTLLDILIRFFFSSLSQSVSITAGSDFVAPTIQN